MPKPSKLSLAPPAAVRSRRAYFDCPFGQLHVRTAFPTTGGFDERVTLFCLHPSSASSRLFSRFLPLMADDRSVYAPDLPGSGESDPPATAGPAQAAAAVSSLAADLRLRQIDVLGFLDGGVVGVELAVARPELVRRIVLVGPPADRVLPALKQQSLVLRAGEFADNVFDAAPQALAEQVRAFL